jgi:hypothetical protein
MIELLESAVRAIFASPILIFLFVFFVVSLAIAGSCNNYSGNGSPSNSEEYFAICNTCFSKISSFEHYEECRECGEYICESCAHGHHPDGNICGDCLRNHEDDEDGYLDEGDEPEINIHK